MNGESLVNQPYHIRYFLFLCSSLNGGGHSLVRRFASPNRVRVRVRVRVQILNVQIYNALLKVHVQITFGIPSNLIFWYQKKAYIFLNL